MRPSLPAVACRSVGPARRPSSHGRHRAGRQHRQRRHAAARGGVLRESRGGQDSRGTWRGPHRTGGKLPQARRPDGLHRGPYAAGARPVPRPPRGHRVPRRTRSRRMRPIQSRGGHVRRARPRPRGIQTIAVALMLTSLISMTSCTRGPAGSTGAPSPPGTARGAVQIVASGFRIPWGVAFLPDGTALVTERGNSAPDQRSATTATPAAIPRILSVSPAGRVAEVQRMPEVSTLFGEGGLLGIAVSPHYASDGWVYVYYSTATDNRIARLHLGQRRQPILTGIPVDTSSPARFHLGGRLAFGPDGMLYASTGETYVARNIAQDPASLGGKILRITPEGRPAPGNPFPNSPVYSLGHRNVQGLAWDSRVRLFATEFGAGRFDGLNLVMPGHGYG